MGERKKKDEKRAEAFIPRIYHKLQLRWMNNQVFLPIYWNYDKTFFFQSHYADSLDHSQQIYFSFFEYVFFSFVVEYG